jgi:hypothetical protein
VKPLSLLFSAACEKNADDAADRLATIGSTAGFPAAIVASSVSAMKMARMVAVRAHSDQKNTR